MNKIVKGSVAAAAAVLLLGGGMGSLAYWQKTATTPGIRVTTGNLGFTTSQAGYSLNGETMSLTAIQNRRVSPGDVLTISQDLYFDVNGSPTVLTVGDIVPDGSQPGLNESLVISYDFGNEVDTYDFLFEQTSTANRFNVWGVGAVTFTITVDWPATADDMAYQLDDLGIADTTLTLDQVHAALPTPTPTPTPTPEPEIN